MFKDGGGLLMDAMVGVENRKTRSVSMNEVGDVRRRGEDLMIEHIEFVINDVYLTCAGNRPERVRELLKLVQG